MREELRDPGRLEHILASIDRIYNFVEGLLFRQVIVSSFFPQTLR